MIRVLRMILREVEETNRLLTLLLKHKVPVYPSADDMMGRWSPDEEAHE